MNQQLVSEWLTDYGSLSPNEVHSFATELEHDQELVTALHNVLEERNKHIEVFILNMFTWRPSKFFVIDHSINSYQRVIK